ncbi:MAG: hypothetical protein ABR570_13870, partial [Burkholderiales bacterium]
MVSVIAAGCGGGGGGGTNTLGNPPAQFTSAQQVQPGQSVVMTGITRSHTLTGSPAVTSAAVNSADTNTSVQVTAGNTAGAALSSFGAVSFPTAQANQSWTSADSPACSAGTCAFSNASSDLVIVAINPSVNFNYQTFGIWDRDLSSTALQVGGFSAGAPTPASAVPTTGAATFNGASLGFYVDPSGVLFTTSASMTANANFGTRNIAFSTTGTSAVNVVSGV